eukprot:gnl/TRDRNA2_/TRDRNA2_85251_c0_seq1.p1 gnl/TRDRNA2_/TRDRNA2_85251_c0~~gnl/TRDRNA2_/TRDRNA2_85251_c0_seq1.p1  ORF type:complete len:320 (-),score=62.85 gnl/TRDRNA2_/TRDRNA2_85251_c0_seq1:30-923(-)
MNRAATVVDPATPVKLKLRSRYAVLDEDDDEDRMSSSSQMGGDTPSTHAETESPINTPVKSSDADSPEELHDGFHLSHSLQDSWCFWVLLPNSKTKDDWQSALTNTYKFSTIEEFWQLMNNIEGPSRLGVVDFSFFKEGIKPAWEDETVKDGGRWVAKVGNLSGKDFDELWLSLACLVIGHSLVDVDSHCLCGIVASTRLKKGNTKISVWISTREETKAMAIGQAFRSLLREFGFSGDLSFEDFKDSSKAVYTIPGDATEADAAEDNEASPVQRKVPAGPSWLSAISSRSWRASKEL